MQKFLNYLKQNKINSSQLAIVCGVEEGTVLNWIDGTEAIDSKTILKLVILSLGELSIFDFFNEYEINEILPNYKNLDFKLFERG